MSFAPLYLTNLWGVMNDNVLKMLVCFVAVRWVPGEWQSVVVNLTAGMLVLPYVLFSPLAGRLPARLSKVRVVRAAKVAELPIMGVAILGFVLHSVPLAMGAVLLMGLQSALYSPAKYGLIKDIGGLEGISEGMGGMEAVSFIGMLSGSVLAAFMADHFSPLGWYATLLGLAALGVLCSLTLRANEVRADDQVPIGPVSFLRFAARLVGQHRGLTGVILLLSLFWWMSASLQTLLILHCDQILGLTPARTGVLLAVMAVGISLGCLVGGRMDKRHNMIGAPALLGLLLMLLLTLLCCFARSLPGVALLSLAVAFVGGLFKIPLDAEIQKRAPADKLSIIIAYFNQVSFIFIFLAAVTNIVVIHIFGTRFVFLLDGLVMGLASLGFILFYRRATEQVGKFFMKLHYNVVEHNREILEQPEGLNMLALPTHRAVIDPLILFAWMDTCHLAPLCDEGFFRIPGIRQILHSFDAIEVPDLALHGRRGATKAMQLKPILIDNLQRGANVLVYPSGHVTTDGHENIGARQLAHDACRALPEHTRVMAVTIDGLWGSRWSRFGRKDTPSLVGLLAQSALIIFSGAVFFMPKRRVDITYEDITYRARQWALLPRLNFNQYLQAYFERHWLDGTGPK